MYKKIKDNKFVKDFLGFLFSSIGIQIILFLTNVFVSRELGPSDKGVYSYLNVLGFFVIPFFSFGFLSGAHFFISRKDYHSRKVYFTVITIGCLIGVITVLLLSLLKEFDFLGNTGNVIPNYIFYPILLTFPIRLIQSFSVRILAADSFFKIVNWFNFFTAIITSVFLFLFVVVLKKKLLGIALALICANLVSFIIILYQIKVNIKPVYTFSIKFCKESFTYGLKSWLGTLAVQANNKVDQLILGFFLSSSNLGLYSVAAGLCQFINLIPNSLRFVLFNKLSSIKSDKEKSIFLNKVHSIVFYIVLVATSFLFIISDFVVSFLYGSEFVKSSLIMKYYIPGVLIYTSTSIITKYFGVINRVEINSYIQLYSAIIGIILNFILIPKIGVIGAAISSTIAYSFTTFIALNYYSKLSKTKIINLFKFKIKYISLLR